jgi:hypothetical protein
MYSNTRHSRKVWTYKNTGVGFATASWYQKAASVDKNQETASRGKLGKEPVRYVTVACRCGGETLTASGAMERVTIRERS